MISMAPVSSAAAAGSYYTADNYYTAEDASLASQWTGAGAADQGLEGAVGLAEFQAVLEGRMPDGTVLSAGEGRERRAGLDMTFSAPKSLSMLAYIGGDKRLLEANMAAVRTTIAWAEKNLAQTRIEIDGKARRVNTGNLLVALFQHDTSRELDPQAHVHAVIANATKGPDGKWRALHNDELWKNNTVLGSIYHAELRSHVDALGYRTEPVGKHGQFEIAGVSKEARDAFSTRRQQILEAYEKLDYQTPETRNAVTIKTRRTKTVIEDRGALHDGWKERAAALGIDLSGMVEAARAAAARGETRWSRVVEGVRDAGDRARALATHIGEIVGARERDPLTPARPWSMSPRELAAAHATASAIRHLAQREAAFKTFEITKTALDFGLPVTVDRIEARVARLVARGLLVQGKGEDAGMMTTDQALRAERAIVAGAGEGRGASPALMGADVAGERLQAHAAAAGGARLNAGQESAGRLILASFDRVVAVQGVAGAGKSTMLAPLAKVLGEDGRRVLGLGFQNKMVRDLAAGAGIEARTVASFLISHARVLDGTASPARIERARAEYGGAFLILDEASMVSNDQKLALVRLANTLEVGRLVLVGDTRQLGAIDAGKPFEVVQRTGTETAHMPENLRARGEAVRAAATAMQEGRVGDALAALKPHTIEAGDQLAEKASELWLALPPAERDATAVYVSGRAHKASVNALIQQGRRERGELGEGVLKLTVLDPVSITREEQRFARSYEPGQVLELRRREQGIAPGQMAILRVDQRTGIVTVRDLDGRERELKPEKIAPNRREETLRLYREKQLELRERDRIRWGDNDRERGLFNADTARVTRLGKDGVTVETSTGISVQLAASDPMLRRIDLAYALNAHMAQGTTSDRGIAIMDSRETKLATERLALVTTTRVRDHLTLVTDDSARLERQLTRQPGDKPSAMEVVREIGAPDLKIQRTPGAASVADTPPPGRATTAAPKKPELERKIEDGGGRQRQMELGL